MHPNSPQHRDNAKLEDFRDLTHRILHLALRGLLRIDFLHEVSKIMIEFSGCDAVEMWLKEREKLCHSEVSRSQRKPFRYEVFPTKADGQEEVLTEIDKLRPQKIIEDGNYKSIAVIPILVADEKIGFMRLKCRPPDFFNKDKIKFYEGIVQTLGVALELRRAQVESRERVKELTCLYGIAKLSEYQSASLKNILQGIVELLPPAWLYPEIASARIVLDDMIFLAPGFCEGVDRQAANIVVEGEKRGAVEVVYSKKRPELDEGPFLREERSLIDTVAREIALIVERKQTEEDRTRLQEQLRHADRLATIGQLSAGVAHELNEPIGSILGFAQLIKKYPELSEQMKQDIEKIMKASLHAREVVKKLMIFARQMPPQKTQVNLNRIVDEGLYFLESRCAKEGIEVRRSLAADLPEVIADPAQMTQVLVNIVVNAIQAMPNGGVLTIKTETAGKDVVLSVEDTGVGMNEKVKQQIFIPFFTTKDVGQGTGLGLSVVHGIIVSHRGSIHFESEIGRGTKFEINLPKAEL